jgi:hypothetical protein
VGAGSSVNVAWGTGELVADGDSLAPIGVSSVSNPFISDTGVQADKYKNINIIAKFILIKKSYPL